MSKDDPAKIVAKVSEKFNKPYEKYYKQAKAASEGGKLKLVEERIVQPFDGYGFEIKKGQVLRYELTHGPQIIDTIYNVKSRPKEEFACTFHTATLGSLILREGMHYWSNTPFARPLLTIIRDTVDYEKLHEKYGLRSGHSFVYPSGRCNAALIEMKDGIPFASTCDDQVKKGMFEVAGEEVARSLGANPDIFMHFQFVHFDAIPPNITYLPGLRFGDIFKKHDFVELLAHDDLYCAFSMCPAGDQNSYADYRKQVNFPLRYAIYEGVDGPLETIPDPKRKSMDAIDFIKAGRPGLVTGVVGEEQF